MESMSGAPYLLPKARFGFRMGDAKTIDAMTHDGLTNPFTGKMNGPGGPPRSPRSLR
jgi:acetyl-CoA C-acetyltransferase